MEFKKTISMKGREPLHFQTASPENLENVEGTESRRTRIENGGEKIIRFRGATARANPPGIAATAVCSFPSLFVLLFVSTH